MQLDVTGTNIEVTEAIRGYVADKLARVQRHSDEVRDAHGALSVEKHRGPVSPIEKSMRRRASGDRHFAEINLNANGTTPTPFCHSNKARGGALAYTLHADAEDRDMYAAIDAMADKIDRQARCHHGKATDHTPHQAQEVPGESPGSGE
ncbi:MAG: ribosome hibernation-promoting factor, HPF/YfiA family [Thiohalorhabdaceae bacterium]